MKKKIIIVVILILLVLIGSVAVGYFFFYKRPVVSSNNVPEVKVTNEIANFGYTLDDRDSELFKEKFNDLKTLLETENYDEEEYVSLVSQLFVIDLYTIDNKISKYDIGGLEYVYEPARESFKSVVMDSIYKTVVNNIDKKREQILPIVDTIEVNDITATTYELPDESVHEAYLVSLSWGYETALGYDTDASILLFKNDQRYDVVSFEPES